MARSEEDCRSFLEQLRWRGLPRCPYCDSTSSSPMPKEGRHHCNNCFTSYSVTVDTPLHSTRVPLTKWFQAISLQSKSNQRISSRILAEEIRINKNTAAKMLKRLQELEHTYPSWVRAIAQFMDS